MARVLCVQERSSVQPGFHYVEVEVQYNQVFTMSRSRFNITRFAYNSQEIGQISAICTYSVELYPTPSKGQTQLMNEVMRWVVGTGEKVQ